MSCRGGYLPLSAVCRGGGCVGTEGEERCADRLREGESSGAQGRRRRRRLDRKDGVKRGAVRSPPLLYPRKFKHRLPRRARRDNFLDRRNRQANLPQAVRLSALPGALPSICVVAMHATCLIITRLGSWLDALSFSSPLGRTRSLGLRDQRVKTRHVASVLGLASMKTRAPSAVSRPSPTNGPGGCCR